MHTAQRIACKDVKRTRKSFNCEYCDIYVFHGEPSIVASGKYGDEFYKIRYCEDCGRITSRWDDDSIVEERRKREGVMPYKIFI